MADGDETRNQHETGQFEGGPSKPLTQEEIRNIKKISVTAGKYLRVFFPLTVVCVLFGIAYEQASYLFILEAVTYLFTALSIAAFVLWFRAKDLN